ncbi:MAG: metallophosphoesterase [Cyanothece sp. SIO1E1]|nr:metallophosphoesterase [Cyanothece sp. SIO1E1]
MRRAFPSVLILIIGFLGCTEQESEPDRIAFLADVHLTNIFGELTDSDFKGIAHPENGEFVIVRTMAAQLRSTRIFNENYFAFIAALDDIAHRGIKIVAFPGDYTDDGQPIHVRGLREILERYESEFGMQFLITTGNHDPVRPFLQDAGKRDFLGEGGKNQPIFSRPGYYTINPEKDHPVVISDDIAEMGYEGILTELGQFGYLAQEKYRYWATPFSSYDPKGYSYENALVASDLANRTYEVAEGFNIPDATYLVEPVEGIWLIAIDGNIYIPKNDGGDENDPGNYGSPGLGYNNFSDNKEYLMDWLSEVSEQARVLDKTIVAFSHYPVVDFNDDASPKLKQLLGETKWQLQRVPAEQIAEDFAKAGIKVHVAGHMHINDTGVRTYLDGSGIVNIQTPSLAAYRPGYKILSVFDDNRIDVETVTIDSVPGFNQLFPLYEMEYSFLENLNEPNLWDRNILTVASYHDFMLWHLTELVRLRFINDWPEPLKSKFLEGDIQDFYGKESSNMNIKVGQLSAYEMLLDFYKIRNADLLAFKDISQSRINEYKKLIDVWSSVEPVSEIEHQTKEFFEILDAFLSGQPADRFTINLGSQPIFIQNESKAN